MTSTRTVDHADLALGAELGRGGQGTVFPVANRRINEAVNGGWEVVYKEYNAATLALLDADALRDMVDLLGDLDADDARWLCDKTAWPVAVVERSGQVCGFLMRAVPDRFRFSVRGLSGTASSKTVLANLEFLLNDESYVAGIGLAISPRDRLELLADLAASLDRLHRLGIAVGDLSPKNLLFTTGQDTGFFIIDCDAMRVHGVSALPQVETPDWQAPAGEEKATGATDVYKFGLLAVRMAAGDQTTTDTTRLATIGAGLGGLARSSLDPDSRRRPMPADWISELNAAAQAAPRVAPGPPPPPPVAAPTAVPVNPRPKPAGKIIARFAGLATAGLIVLAIALGSNHSSNVAGTTGGTSATGGTTTSGGGTTSSGGDSSSSGGTTSSGGGSSSGGGTTSSGGDSSSSGGTTSSGGDTGGFTPQPPPPPQDLIKTLQIGDCVTDSAPSTATNAQLSSSGCVPGAFKIVAAFDNTTDLDSCKDVGQVSQSVSSSADDRVVCLSYQANGTAYWAKPGQCVYGANSSGSSWDVEDCQTGNFKVVARYPQTSDKSRCPAWPQSNEEYTYPNSDNGLAVLLCLTMNYPDALGLATRNECLVKNGNTFTNVDSCPDSNVVVSGRTSTYDDPGFCGQDGASWWRPSEFPDLGYTVCWRWKQ